MDTTKIIGEKKYQLRGGAVIERKGEREEKERED